MSDIQVLPRILPPELRSNTVTYIILAVLQVLDVATTWVILNYWSMHAEGNPLVATFLGWSGLTTGLLMLLVLKLAGVWFLYLCQFGTRIIQAVYGLVILNNLLFLALWLLT